MDGGHLWILPTYCNCFVRVSGKIVRAKRFISCVFVFFFVCIFQCSALSQFRVGIIADIYSIICGVVYTILCCIYPFNIKTRQHFRCVIGYKVHTCVLTLCIMNMKHETWHWTWMSNFKMITAKNKQNSWHSIGYPCQECILLTCRGSWWI